MAVCICESVLVYFLCTSAVFLSIKFLITYQKKKKKSEMFIKFDLKEFSIKMLSCALHVIAFSIT